MVERPVDPAVRLGYEFGVTREERQGNQAIEEVRAAFPTFASAAEPSTIRSEVGPELVEMAGEAPCLQLKFVQEPSLGFDSCKSQCLERSWLERGAIRNGIGRKDRIGY